MGGFDTLVGEHLGDRIDFRAECDLERGKGVACEVEGQSLLDTANRCNLFEVVVTPLSSFGIGIVGRGELHRILPDFIGLQKCKDL